MYVTGLLDGDGIIVGVLNDFQYFCSGVIGEGPEGNFRGVSPLTGADMMRWRKEEEEEEER